MSLSVEPPEVEKPPVFPAPLPTHSEFRRVWLFALLLVLLTSLPYFVGYQTQGENWRFTGFVFGVEDGNSYIAKMLAGTYGNWLFRTPYTAEGQSGMLAFLPYLVLGKLAAPPGLHEQLVALFHLFRTAGILLVCYSVYRFISLWIADPGLRYWGLCLATLGGGLGWLLPVILPGSAFERWLVATPRGQIPGLTMPLEFYSPETFGFLGLYGLPHLAAGRGLLLLGLATILTGSNPAWLDRFAARWGGWISASGLWAGILFLLLGLMQPLTVVIAWAVLAGFLCALVILRRRAAFPQPFFRRSAWAVGVSAPLVVYTMLAFRLDPFLQVWAGQNRILSPHVFFYLVGYVLLLPFLVGGARRILCARGEAAWLPLVWAAMIPLLAYVPYNLQRRLPEGSWVALVVLALAWATAHGIAEPSRKRWLYPVTAPGFMAAVILIVGGVSSAIHPGEPLFRPVDEVSAFEQLAGHAMPGEVVLTGYQTGNALPAFAALRVVIGHGPESAGLAELLPQVESFYGGELDTAEQRAFLAEQGVAYIFWGPREKMSGGWKPDDLTNLTPVAAAGDYIVYRLGK